MLAVLAALQGAAVQEAFAAGSAPNPVGPEFQVNTTTAKRQVAPAMAMNADGNFVVVWLSDVKVPPIYPYRVHARRYDKNGNALDPTEFQVNTTTDTTADQFTPAVAMDTNGNFVVAWQSNRPGGAGSGIFAKLYNKDGGIVKDEFLVNTPTQNARINPAVAMDTKNGNFVVTWQSNKAGWRRLGHLCQALRQGWRDSEG